MADQYVAGCTHFVTVGRCTTGEFDSNGEALTRPVTREIAYGSIFCPAEFGISQAEIDEMLADGWLAEVGSPEAASIAARSRSLAGGGQ